MINKEKLKDLPKTPGVYLYKDNLGKIIYVGKANNLNSRVRQYFQSSRNLDEKTKILVKNVDDLTYITTGTEMEAFILESNLIKKHSPKYNILLKDDKTYPYIKITTSEKFPRVVKTRMQKKGEDIYFGPYSDTGAVNRMVDFINQIFPTKKCTYKEFKAGFRPCLNYHIHKCKGVCVDKISEEEYKKIIDDILDFLKGKDKSIDKFLKEKMKKASEEMRYEEALKYRNYIYGAKAIREKQRVVIANKEDVDVVIFDGREQIYVFSVIGSKLIDRQVYKVDSSKMALNKETGIVLEFIRQHYSKEMKGPQQIIIEENQELPKNLEKKNIEMLEEYLKGIWQRKIRITFPKKGEMKELLSLAKADVIEQNKVIAERIEKEEERESNLEKSLKKFGEFSSKPKTEAFDVSNTFGVDSVGAMVVFEGLNPIKSKYRKFKVKTKSQTAIGSDDYGSTQEIIFRRLKKAIEGDKGFLPLPEIIFLDGGKGHLEVAEEVLNTAITISNSIGNHEDVDTESPITNQLKNIRLIGMAKDKKHRSDKLVYRESKEEIVEYSLKDDKFLYSYIGNIQEEVHRFAINYHKALRGKTVVKSELENIKGIGRIKRNNLLKELGSIKAIKEASKEKLISVEKISKADAEEIKKYFSKS